MKITALFLILGTSVAFSAAPMPNVKNQETQQEQRKVTGTVVDATGLPLLGVSIQVKGVPGGVTTNIDGYYSIQVSGNNATLVFSYISYETKEVIVGSQTKIDITLDDDEQMLDEVVVIGYGTQRKKDLTSSVTSLKSDALTAGAIGMNPLQAAEGKVAGLTITRNNGNDPNAGLGIQLRGLSTAKGAQGPLIVINGVPGGDWTTLSQQDIESIDVLKDGSAAAIYGTRGTNGVILITTKKGQAGTTKVDFEAMMFTETIEKKLEVMSAAQYRQYAKDNAKTIVDEGASTDWFDELVKTPLSQMYNLALTGGSEQFSYRASLSYRDQNGITAVPTSKEAIITRVNMSQKAWDNKLKFDMNFAYTNMQSRLTDYASFDHALKRNPTEPVYNPDGTFYYPAAPSYEFDRNPVAALANREDGLESHRFMGDFRITLELLPGLRASAMAAMRREMNLSHYYDNRTSEESAKNGSSGTAKRYTTNYMDRTFEGTVDYNKVIGKHSFSAMGGYTYQDFMYEKYEATNKGFITDVFQWNNLGAGSFLKAGNAEMMSEKTSSKLIAFFGRATYNYDDKYLLTATFRREGSSRFGDNHKWGDFPAASVAWRISNESFMKGVEWLSDLKLRAGYGVTGNQMDKNYISIARLTGQQRIWQGNPNPAEKDKYILSYGPSSNPNPDLKWEMKREYNAGLDISVLNSRAGASLDVYQRENSDLLYEVQAPVPALLYPTIWANVGDMSSKGVELVLYGDPVKTKDFVWNVSFNMAYNKSKVGSMSNEKYASAANFLEFSALPAPGNLGNAIRFEKGQEVGNFFGYKYLGLTDEGKWIFEDVDKSGTVNDADKQIIGNGVPKWVGGFTTTFTYKRFDLTMALKGAFKFDILNVKEIFYGNQTTFPGNNLMLSALDRHKDLKDQMRYSSYYLEKGDYLKISNATLAYNFNTSKISKYIGRLRLYVSTDNLYTFTNYTGVDPELRSNGLEDLGLDKRDYYPRTRTITFGLNVGF